MPMPSENLRQLKAVKGESYESSPHSYIRTHKGARADVTHTNISRRRFMKQIEMGFLNSSSLLILLPVIFPPKDFLQNSNNCYVKFSIKAKEKTKRNPSSMGQRKAQDIRVNESRKCARGKGNEIEKGSTIGITFLRIHFFSAKLPFPFFVWRKNFNTFMFVLYFCFTFFYFISTEWTQEKRMPSGTFSQLFFVNAKDYLLSLRLKIVIWKLNWVFLFQQHYNKPGYEKGGISK